MTHIYLIGSLGYQGRRQYGTTPVYRLDTKTFRIEAIQTSGDISGWIYQHQAIPCAPHEIRVSGGRIVTWDDNREVYTENEKFFILDTQRLVWRRNLTNGDAKSRS